MKKRNTEGFALAYVVVVITVLCTLAIGLMSISLRILQVQDKNMQRMKEKYEAQGVIECFLADLDTYIPSGLKLTATVDNFKYVDDFVDDTNPDRNPESAAKDASYNAAKLAVGNYFSALFANSKYNYTDQDKVSSAKLITEIISDNTGDYYSVECIASKNDAEVHMVLKIPFAIEVTPGTLSSVVDNTDSIYFMYEVKNFEIELISYTIGSLGGGT